MGQDHEGKMRPRLIIGTVELHSKGPDRKGNLPIREMISGFINHYFIGYKGISVYEKN